VDNAVARFWGRCIEFVQKQGVKGSGRRWYVKRVEQYTQTYPDQKLLAHTPGLVTRFLEDEGRNTSLKDWQFIQAVDAIQKLFIMINAPCLDKVDWAHWRSFAHTFPRCHTILERGSCFQRTG